MAILQGAQESWIKSSHSGGNGACVEVRSPVVAALSVRDSKVTDGPVLAFPAGAWNTFVASVKA
ncbi:MULTISPECIES: DUF397 domain-containing protein [unclassified Streptomyces]|uniref:DUF397 domain-containing protein n=1 Tax=unclassified Streptomyces TaxID=2593676 RepID=UPI001370D5FA|nr:MULTISPECIES: DUF397 domain-containing protein [unclassified Streptomyces]MCW5254528.1 DUF397 domain-containing protein [Streptomyces sp. SHP 1-2]MYU20416.1 DUF397 domain-containing protein [Streptomyces sp. SID8352]